MANEIRVRSVVLPGGRVAVTVPWLPTGQTVEVVVTVPEDAPPPMGIADWLRSLPPSTRTPEEWEEFERQFQEERNSWDR